jgi:hypothetical protein
MLYALNLVDAGDCDVCRTYATAGGPVAPALGDDLAVMSKKAPEVPVPFPGTTRCGAPRMLARARG